MWPFSLSNFTPLTWFSKPSRPIEFTVLKDEQGDIIMEGCPPPWPRNTAEDVREQYERRLERVPSPQTHLALRSYGHVEGRFLPRLLAPRAFCAVKAARAALAHYGWRHDFRVRSPGRELRKTKVGAAAFRYMNLNWRVPGPTAGVKRGFHESVSEEHWDSEDFAPDWNLKLYPTPFGPPAKRRQLSSDSLLARAHEYPTPPASPESVPSTSGCHGPSPSPPRPIPASSKRSPVPASRSPFFKPITKKVIRRQKEAKRVVSNGLKQLTGDRLKKTFSHDMVRELPPSPPKPLSTPSVPTTPPASSKVPATDSGVPPTGPSVPSAGPSASPGATSAPPVAPVGEDVPPVGESVPPAGASVPPADSGAPSAGPTAQPPPRPILRPKSRLPDGSKIAPVSQPGPSTAPESPPTASPSVLADLLKPTYSPVYEKPATDNTLFIRSDIREVVLLGNHHSALHVPPKFSASAKNAPTSLLAGFRARLRSDQTRQVAELALGLLWQNGFSPLDSLKDALKTKKSVGDEAVLDMAQDVFEKRLIVDCYKVDLVISGQEQENFLHTGGLSDQDKEWVEAVLEKGRAGYTWLFEKEYLVASKPSQHGRLQDLARRAGWCLPLHNKNHWDPIADALQRSQLGDIEALRSIAEYDARCPRFLRQVAARSFKPRK